MRGLHIVLEAIEDHWKENDLKRKHKQNLEILGKGCQETLDELGSVLKKYESLGMERKRPTDRLRWSAKNLGPIRTNLINSAASLSMFHDTVTSVIPNLSEI